MQSPQPFATSAGESPDVSRRFVLAIGGAGALMAAGCVTPMPGPDQPPEICLTEDARSVVTPPHTQSTILKLQSGSKLQDRAAQSQGSLISTEVAPFRITPRKTAARASLTGDELARRAQLATLASNQTDNEDALRDLVVDKFMLRVDCVPPKDSKWDSQTGVGPSMITLYRDVKKKQICETIDVAGVPVETIQDSIFHMRTDSQRQDQIKLQVSIPNVYLAVALTVDDQVRAGQEKVNWTCQAINCVGWFTTRTVLDLKKGLRVPRPWQISTDAPNPIIKVPCYTAYPGGHAAYLAALHVVLMDITGTNAKDASKFRGLPDRIAENRERAGLHTRVDTRAGWELGTALGHALVRWVDLNDDMDWAVIYKSAKAEWS